MYLNCHTYFSFRYGTLSVKELFEETKRCGIHKIVLTDINNTAAYIELLRIIEEEENSHILDVAVGIEFRNESELYYVAIAKNNAGFHELNAFLSLSAMPGRSLPKRPPPFENAFIIYPWRACAPEELYEHEFVGIRIHELNQFATYSPPQQHKFVAWHPVTFKDDRPAKINLSSEQGTILNNRDSTASVIKKQVRQKPQHQNINFNIHRLLRAIDNNTLLSKLSTAQLAQENEVMMSAQEFSFHYRKFPWLINNSNELIEQCNIDFNLHEDKNKRYVTTNAIDDLKYLTSKAREGFLERYTNVTDPALIERFNRELRTIEAKNFTSYFLITHDIIEFARKSGFEYVGRGSGANSLIAYCLGITNVDPIELDLYFERFLNSERTSPPDFDLDFSWKDRDTMIDYIIKTYGVGHTCLLGTHVTYQSNSIIRELGKVFGLPKSEIDDLLNCPESNIAQENIRQVILRYAERMRDMPANMSIHAGGVLITEKPVYTYTATTSSPKGVPVSHFEMHNAEDIGIYKFDILSQRGLGHIKDAVNIVNENRGIVIDIKRINDFKTDKKIKALLKTGKTVGCFYVESPSMRMLLEKLQCDDYITLVAASSIIRPGVASSGMMRTYIERHKLAKEGKPYESIHAKMDALMKDTYGVMIYQEDVIKVAHEFAHLTLTEADTLRRGMSGKFRSRSAFEKIKTQFHKNCRRLGYDDVVTKRVWFEIESFSGYSFSKGHSASYAVESYQSLYLKAHYPLEFIVAVINNFGGFYQTEFYFHEARMNGGVVEAPCINKSHHLTHIVGNNIYVGFIHIKSLQEAISKKIENERRQHGAYKNLSNFISRVKIGLEQVRMLIRIGAFRFTGKSKQKLLWEAMLYFGEMTSRKQIVDELFDTEPVDYPLPHLERNNIEDAFDEMELLGFALCDPFMLVDTTDYGNAAASTLIQKLGCHVEIIGYHVTQKVTKTRNGKTMYFGTFQDRAGNIFDSIHFPSAAIRSPFRGKGFYKLKGKVVEDFGVPLLDVTAMEKLPWLKK